MTKNEFIEAYNRADKQHKEDTGFNLVPALFASTLTMFSLVRAFGKARKGNHVAGAFWLLLWHGLNSNYNNQISEYRANKRAGIK